MKSLRVLHVVGRMQAGGVEVRLLELMRRVSPAEFRVDICALSGLPGAFDHEVRALGGQVIQLAVRKPWFAARFWRLLRQGGYDVVHSNVHYASGLVLALAARAGVPVRVAHFHNTHDGRRATLLRRAVERTQRYLIARNATDIVGCCQAVLDHAWSPQWGTDPRCGVIYYGTDPSPFAPRGEGAALRRELGIPDESRVFLHLGRVTRQKNHRRLLEVFAEILRTAPASHLVLAGFGTDAPDGEIAHIARDLHIEERVMTLGPRDDVPRLLAAADILLLPSLWEGLPNVVLEACAAGVPVLSTDLPGVREVATRLSLVRWLELTRGSAEWARVALELPAEAERLRLKETATEAFRASVFHVARAVEANCALWRRGAEGSAVPTRMAECAK